MRHFFERYIPCTAAILAIVLAGPVPSQAAGTWQVGTPIVTWWGQWNLTPQIATLAINGGYNLVTCGTLSQVDLANTYGLRAQLAPDGGWEAGATGLIGPGSLDGGTKQAALDALINAYKNKPAAYSYYITNEPAPSQFDGLNQIVDYLRQKDPSHLPYICLLAADAYPNYEQGYLMPYFSTVHPSLLSNDHYPLLSPSGTKSLYYSNLWLGKHYSQKAGVPFMPVVQACGEPGIVPATRVPNAIEMRFLVYNTLAFGAQGISYYNYNVPPGYGGLVDASGNPTSLYNVLTPLNHQFINIATMLGGSPDWIGTYSKGPTLPGLDPLPGSSPFTLSGSSSLVVGLFGDGNALSDSQYALVVNQSLTAFSYTTLTGPENLSIFNATTGVWTPTGSRQASLSLPPGGGMLVRLASVPEPCSWMLFGIGAACLLGYGLYKRG
jgi:hypothetical protein